MGFHLRKSINLGGIRVNLSNSGLGFSTGVKGLRFGVDGKGRTYIGGGKGILRYRKYVSTNSRTNKKQTKPKENYPETTKNTGKPSELADTYIISNILTAICALLFPFWLISIALIFDKEVGPSIFITLTVLYAVNFWLFHLSRRNHKISMGIKHFEKGEYDKAKEILSKYLNYDFKTYESKEYLNDIMYRCFINEENFEGALNFIQDNNFVPDRRERTMSLFYKLEKYEELISYMQRNTTQVEKQSVPYLIVVSEAFLKLGKPDIALQTVLQGPIRKRNMNDEICAFRYQLGLCYEATGDIKNAQKQYEKVYSYNADWEDVREKISKQ